MNDLPDSRFRDFQRPPSEPILNLPKPVSNLLIALFAVHVVVLLLPARLFADVFLIFGVVPGRYTALFVSDFSLGDILVSAVGLIGYQFLHSGWVHLLMNSAWLAVFGTAVAYRFGASPSARSKFYIFSMLCGIAGAVTHIVIYPTSYVPLVGASAAIAGLMGAALRIMFVSPLAQWRGGQPLADIGDKRVLVFAGVYILVNVLTGVFGFGDVTGAGQIAWQAHLGGFFTGLFLIRLFSRA